MAGAVVRIIGQLGYRAYQARRAVQAARAAQAAKRLADAARAAKALSEAADRAKALQNCPAKIPCFTAPAGADPNEFMRQLKEQQDAINNSSPTDLLNRINAYERLKRAAAVGDALKRAAARSEYSEARIEQVTREILSRNPGMTGRSAARQAERMVADEMSRLDATHDLDLRAGGSGRISGLADRAINRSIGSQWARGRADALKEEARKAAAKGQGKMNVELEKCP